MKSQHSLIYYLNKINPWNIVKFTKQIKDNFGIKFTLILSSVYYGLKGFIYSGVNLTLLPYTKAIPFSPQKYQLISSLSLIPWSIKGIFGVLSDIFPLFGYQKTYYMLISCAFSTASLCIIVLLPYSFARENDLVLAFLLFLVHLSPSICDLLCEGKYVEQMKLRPETKASIVLYVWWCQVSAGLIASIFVGVMADNMDPRYIFIVFIPAAIQPVIFLSTGCMIDDKVPKEQSNRFNMEKVRKKGNYLMIGIITALGAMGTFLMALVTNSSLAQLIYALCISTIMILLAFLFMGRMIAKANLYMFLTFVLYVNVTGALDYFYTADETCVPDGPHFDNVFYRTYTSLASDVFSLLGLYLFDTFIVKMKFRKAFWITTCIRVLASVVDIVLVKRWNRAMGISDHLMYMVGDAMIYRLVYMMDFLPGTLLTAKLCPREVESTVYAILAGFSNFGQTTSSLIGIFLTDLFGIDGLPEDVDASPCNFENLHWLVLFSHCILPLTAIPLTFVLIPDASIETDILEESIPKEKFNINTNSNDIDNSASSSQTV